MSEQFAFDESVRKLESEEDDKNSVVLHSDDVEEPEEEVKEEIKNEVDKSAKDQTYKRVQLDISWDNSFKMSRSDSLDIPRRQRGNEYIPMVDFLSASPGKGDEQLEIIKEQRERALHVIKKKDLRLSAEILRTSRGPPKVNHKRSHSQGNPTASLVSPRKSAIKEFFHLSHVDLPEANRKTAEYELDQRTLNRHYTKVWKRAVEKTRESYFVNIETKTNQSVIIEYLLIVPGVAFLLLLLGFLTDLGTARQPGEKSTFGALAQSIVSPDFEQTRFALGAYLRGMMNLFGTMLTCSGVIIQLTSTRFTPQARRLFLTDRKANIIIAFNVITMIYLVVCVLIAGDQYNPRWEAFIGCILVIICIMMSFPYFYYIFSFLDPSRIVSELRNEGLVATERNDILNLDARKYKALNSIEYLTNIALSNVQRRESSISFSVLNSMTTFIILYGDTKLFKPNEWYTMPEWMKQTADFNLPDKVLKKIQKNNIWLEYSLLKHFLMIYNESIPIAVELCKIVAANTGKIAETAARRGDLKVLDLCIKFFNTYLRGAISANNHQLAAAVAYQYRLVAEFLLSICYVTSASTEATTNADLRTAPEPQPQPRIPTKMVSFASLPNTNTVSSLADKNVKVELMPLGAKGMGEFDNINHLAPELHQRVVKITYYLGLYLQECIKVLLKPAAEALAHDIGFLCEIAFILHAPCHEEMFKNFMDKKKKTSSNIKVPLRVLCSKIRLASTYLVLGAIDYAKRIQEAITNEPVDRLIEAWQIFENMDTEDSWEITDRLNYNYLTKGQKARLTTFFGWFQSLKDAVYFEPENKDNKHS